jgi:hypothetical protein
MKYLRLLNILPVSFFIFALLALPAMATSHGMTGNLYADWGVNLNQAYIDDAAHSTSNSQNWVPSSSTADYVIENNIDPSTNGHDWTGYYSTGTHLMKNADYQNPTTFIESMLGSYYSPAGGEPFDIEALYFDNDASNVYIAVVTSMGINGYDLQDNNLHDYEYGASTNDNGHIEPGDIAIDLDNNNVYEYGVITHADEGETDANSRTGHLILNPSWSQSNLGLSQNPGNDADFVSGKSTDKNGISMRYDSLPTISETVKYNNAYRTTFSGNDLPPEKLTRTVTKNLIEISIPREKLGSPSDTTLGNIHLTIGCGNDVIELKKVKFDSVPEFPSMVLPVAAILGIIFVLDRRNKK